MAAFDSKVTEATSGHDPDVLGVVALSLDRDGTSNARTHSSKIPLVHLYAY